MKDYHEEPNRQDDIIINEDGSIAHDKKTKVDFNSKLYTRVFGYLGLSILIMGVVALILGIIFEKLVGFREFEIAYILVLCFGAIGMLIGTFMINFGIRREGGLAGILGFITYSICIGAILSVICYAIGDAYVVGSAVIATAVVFILMCGLGYILGDKIKFAYIILTTLVIGLFILFLVDFLILPLITLTGGMSFESFFNATNGIYFAVEAIVLVLALLYIAIDMNRLRKIADSGKYVTNNIALMLAMCLVSDIVYLFIRLLYIFAILFAGKRK